MKSTPVFMALVVALLLITLGPAGLSAVEFEVESVDPIAQGNRTTSLKIDDSGGIHIAYTGCSDDLCDDGELRRAYRPAGGEDWEIDRVDIPRDVGWFVGLDFDASGYAHIAYCDHDRRLLKYATNAPGGGACFVESSGLDDEWTAEALQKTGYGAGWWARLALDEGGGIHISHTKILNSSYDGNLEYVYGDGQGGWDHITADTLGDTGWYTAIAVDGEGTVHIVYHTWVTNYLRHAWKPVGGSWETETVDSGGTSTAIVIAGDGTLHVAHTYCFDTGCSDGDLRYARKSGDAWELFELVTEGDSGYFPSIDLDDAGGLHIAYRNYDEGDLMYTRNFGEGWEHSIADSVGNTGLYTSIATDDSGGVHISCENFLELRYAHCGDCAVH